MEEMTDIDKLVLLEAIRQTGNSIKFPISGNWGHLEDNILALVEEGLLTFTDKEYQISEEGKKAVLLFNAEKEDLLKSLEVYKEVRANGKLIDARLPVEAYRTRKQNPVRQEEYLETVATMVIWDGFFSTIKSFSDAVIWQRNLFTAFKQSVRNLSGRYSWRHLGSNIQDATMVAERLINPYPSRQLIEKVKRG